jgi:hypothetical protein
MIEDIEDDMALDFGWLEVRHKIKEDMGYDKLPDLNAVLLLIGIQELGRWRKTYSKQEKQDLMHVAACRLLSAEGYYSFLGRDDEGWPHWKMEKPLTTSGLKNQEVLLKQLIVQYFKELNQEYKELNIV